MVHVLIIEDDPTLQTAYKTTLSIEGYEAMVASDGEEGWKLAKQHKPDLILLDMLMPHLSGYDFLKRRQHDDDLKVIKVIVFSNVNAPDDVDETLAMGAAKYVTKSNFTPKEMVATIKEVLSTKPVSS